MRHFLQGEERRRNLLARGASLRTDFSRFLRGALQSLRWVWRYSCALGYHGESVRESNQRQSGIRGKSTRTLMPSPLARCATEVSTVTSSSTSVRMAAVSSKLWISGLRLVTLLPAGNAESCVAASPFCTEMYST